MHANESANVYFHGSGNNQTHGGKTPPVKRFNDRVAFAFSDPLSVASQRQFCQGKTHMDVRFSMDKPGRRIHAALKQS
jgi:hypothetical protein